MNEWMEQKYIRILHSDVNLEKKSLKYDVSTQFLGFGLVLLFSLLGVSSFLLIIHLNNRSEDYALFSNILLLIKGISCGVIISTGFVHLIDESYEKFEKVGWSGNGKFHAWPMIFTMVGLVLMGLLDVLIKKYDIHRLKVSKNSQVSEFPPAGLTEDFSVLSNFTKDHSIHELNLNEFKKKSDNIYIGDVEHPFNHKIDDNVDHIVHSVPNNQISTFMIEISILTHSIIIGFDLGLQNVSSWNQLVIAICFHQFFEGIAFGKIMTNSHKIYSRDSYFSRTVLWPFISYIFVTPIGILCGILTRVSVKSYVETPAVSTTIAILNSICGGILVYIGLLHFFKPWFLELTETKYDSFGGILSIFIGYVLGLSVMSIIGIWA